MVWSREEEVLVNMNVRIRLPVSVSHPPTVCLCLPLSGRLSHTDRDFDSKKKKESYIFITKCGGFFPHQSIQHNPCIICRRMCDVYTERSFIQKIFDNRLNVGLLQARVWVTVLFNSISTPVGHLMPKRLFLISVIKIAVL